MSRIDPVNLSYAEVGTGKYLTFSAAPDTYVIALSMIMVNKCAVYDLPKAALGQRRKEIRGNFHSQEFERMMGVLGIVYRRNLFKPSIFDSAIQFTTIPLASSQNGICFIFRLYNLELKLMGQTAPITPKKWQGTLKNNIGQSYSGTSTGYKKVKSSYDHGKLYFYVAYEV